MSRQHCCLKIQNGALLISDMGSRNGTFVNGEMLKAEHTAKVGDTLRVSRLQFEIVIDHGQPGNKKPKVQDVAEAAARTVSSTGGGGRFDEDSISDWLSKSEEDEKTLQDTQQFSLEDTPSVFSRADAVESPEKDEESVDGPVSGTEAEDSGSKRHKKKSYKKLPPREAMKAENSKCAADDVLKKFFNRR